MEDKNNFCYGIYNLVSIIKMIGDIFDGKNKNYY